MLLAVGLGMIALGLFCLRDMRRWDVVRRRPPRVRDYATAVIGVLTFPTFVLVGAGVVLSSTVGLFGSVTVLALLSLLIAFPLWIGYRAEKRGLSFIGWAVLAVLLGPIAPLALALAGRGDDDRDG